MALAVAIFAIVIIGMLVAGVFYASYLEQRTGENTLYAQQAFEAAESGMADAMSNWNQSVYGAFPVDTPQALAAVTTGRTRYTPIITRLNSELFLVSARGEQLDAGGRVLARRVLGTLARLSPTDVDVQAAVTSQGTVKVGGNATVDGNDHTPRAGRVARHLALRRRACAPTGWFRSSAVARRSGIRRTTSTTRPSSTRCSPTRSTT